MPAAPCIAGHPGSWSRALAPLCYRAVARAAGTTSQQLRIDFCHTVHPGARLQHPVCRHPFHNGRASSQGEVPYLQARLTALQTIATSMQNFTTDFSCISFGARS